MNSDIQGIESEIQFAGHIEAARKLKVLCWSEDYSSTSWIQVRNPLKDESVRYINDTTYIEGLSVSYIE